jgi:hypothetical protein
MNPRAEEGTQMSEQVEFNCPHCGQTYRLSVEQLTRHAGHSTTCRKCQQAFMFPDVPPEEEPPADELPAEEPAAPEAAAPAASAEVAEEPAAAAEQAPSQARSPVAEEEHTPAAREPAGYVAPAAAVHRRASHQAAGFGAILGFRAFVGRPLVNVAFWGLLLLCVLWGVQMIQAGLAASQPLTTLIGLLVIVDGILFSRALCEGILAAIQAQEWMQRLQRTFENRRRD